MRNYNTTHTEEKETYPEYKTRKRKDWDKRLREICIEIKDSSFKEDDKERTVFDMIKKLSAGEIWNL